MQTAAKIRASNERHRLIFYFLVLFLPLLALRTAVAEEPIQKFAQAVKSGNHAVVETMLEDGLDPNTRIPGYWLGYTPLFIAVNNNDLELTQILLAAGADPKVEDENGDPVMVHASDHDTIKVARFLISQGFSIDAKNGAGITALMRDAPYAKENDIQAKIDLGASLDLTDPEGNTALMIAAESRNLDAMKTLVAAGANIDLQNDQGKTALMLTIDSKYAYDEKAPSAAGILIEGGADLELRDTTGKCALLLALDTWSTEEPLIAALLEGKPRLDVRDEESGQSPLFLAVVRDKFRGIVSKMLEQGADPKIIDNYGVDLTMHAAKNANIALLRDLMGRGLSLTRKDSSGESIAHWAARNYPPDYYNTTEDEKAAHPKTVVDTLGFLLEHGIALDQPDSEGVMPLHIAVGGGMVSVAEFLIPHYDDLTLRDQKGRTFLHDAAASGSIATLDLFLPHIDIDAADHQGRTALWDAILANQNGLAQHLLQAGANIDATDKGNRTLLEEMVLLDDFEHTRLLVDRGADPGKLGNPDSLLRHASRFFQDNAVREDDYSFLIGVLAPLAENVDAPDAEGLTPLMWIAASNNHSALASILSQKPDLNA